MPKLRTLQALLFLALVLPGVTRSQTIYKCAVKGQPISYQTQPCAANAEVKAIQHYQQYTPSTYRAPPPAPTPARAVNRQAQGAQLHNIPLGTGNQCEAAKRERAAWERQVGLARTYDSLLAWNERVQRACK
jgi:hypothetical protein